MIFLLDQNIPKSIRSWLADHLPEHTIYHTNDLNMEKARDRDVYQWASNNQAVIITFDYDFIEDFARLQTAGIIHLRANPTNRENAIECLFHVFSVLKPEECNQMLVIAKQRKIRVFEFVTQTSR
jgi:predicted nuclease of predicted toxin-antitoxin system